MEQQVTLTIDGKKVKVRRGTTILEAARQAGAYVPFLCYHPVLKPFAACRMCVVEVENRRGFPTSCTEQVAEGMAVKTRSPGVEKVRKEVMTLVLSEHPHGCLNCNRSEHCVIGATNDVCLRNVSVNDRCVACPKNKRCELQDQAYYLKMAEVPLPYGYRNLPVKTEDPFYDRDYNLCILCGRCVRICDELRGLSAITYVQRGGPEVIGTSLGGSLVESGCDFCGACIDVCPVGALTEKGNKWAGAADKTVTTTCGYCSVGCQLKLEVKAGKVTRATGDFDAHNLGQLCVKGKFGADFVQSEWRVTRPMLRKDGALGEATWEEAFTYLAERLAAYRGPAFALLTSGRLANEENYALQKFARVAMASSNVDYWDTSAHSLRGLAQVLGYGASTNSLQELAQAACVFAIGTNTTVDHEVASLPIRKALREHNARLIVADAREVAIGRLASAWLKPRPGTELMLIGAIIRAIFDNDLADHEFLSKHCEGLDGLKESLKDFSLQRAEEATGVPGDQMLEAARMYATVKPAAIVYAGGSPELASALATLALITGNIGKPSSGVHALGEVANAQGTYDMGCVPDLLPGQQLLTDDSVRQSFESAWGVKLPEAGLSASDSMRAASQGRVKCLFLAGENPLLDGLAGDGASRALQNVELLVVADNYLSEAAQRAHVVLPLASFVEKDGTFTSGERRVQDVRQAVDAPGIAMPGWWIACQLARRMGVQGFEHRSPEDLRQEVSSLAPLYRGSNGHLNARGFRWPLHADGKGDTPVLYAQGFPRGKAQLARLRYQPGPQAGGQFPYLLSAGRLFFDYHPGKPARWVKGLNSLQGELVVELHPQEASALALSNGERVELVTPQARLKAVVGINQGGVPGTVMLNLHMTEHAGDPLPAPALELASRAFPRLLMPVRIEKVAQ